MSSANFSDGFMYSMALRGGCGGCEQAIGASMSSRGVMTDDLVLPGGLVGGHRAVDDGDEVALQDPACSAGSFGWLVAR
jgi:hypothetical protein